MHYEENKERITERNRSWRSEHIDAILLKQKEHYRKHRGEYLARAKERKSRKKAATIIPFTSAQLDQRMSMNGHRCYLCGGPFEHVDHVKPLSKGGAHALCNLRPTCAKCNRAKHDKWPYAPAAVIRCTAPAAVNVRGGLDLERI
jgi:5-methylcytosine-specific restriction endonuclease McrA